MIHLFTSFIDHRSGLDLEITGKKITIKLAVIY